MYRQLPMFRRFNLPKADCHAIVLKCHPNIAETPLLYLCLYVADINLSISDYKKKSSLSALFKNKRIKYSKDSAKKYIVKTFKDDQVSTSNRLSYKMFRFRIYRNGYNRPL